VTPELTGWIPFKIRVIDQRAFADWCYLGRERFTAPFFRDTLDRCLRKPFNQLFQQTTTIEQLVDRAATHPGIRPTALIFHSSRCGSTLLAQMAAAMPGTIVLSEPVPVDHVLRAPAPESLRIEWLKALVNALGQPREGESHLVVKFDAWHVLQVDAVQRAFPGVPSVFVYREPAAVIASQMRMAGIHMVPGMIDPSIIGLDLAGVLQLGREEYAARLLGAVYAAAAEAVEAGRLTPVNYVELPQRGFSMVLDWCTPEDPDGALAQLHHVASFDSKTPSLPYDAASASAPVTPAVIEAASRFVEPYYQRLEAVRVPGCQGARVPGCQD